jgi:GMP synthase-like glutamine amidotransferase
MNILLFDNGSKYLPRLKKLLNSFGKLQVINESEQLNSADTDFTVLSGGHKFSVLSHPDYYQNEIDFIKNTNKPVLGICLGAELIA